MSSLLPPCSDGFTKFTFMKRAKRMILVPEEVMERCEQRQRLGTSPIMNSMLNKGKQLTDILESTDVGDAEKQKLFNAPLERYLALREQKNNEIPAVKIIFKEEEQVEQPEKLSDELILRNIPKTMRERAR